MLANLKGANLGKPALGFSSRGVLLAAEGIAEMMAQLVGDLFPFRPRRLHPLDESLHVVSRHRKIVRAFSITYRVAPVAIGTTEHTEATLSLRVGEDIAALAPHRPERAQFTHSVLHSTASRMIRCSDGRF